MPPPVGRLLPQPLLEDPAAPALGQAGQLPVDLRRDLRPPGTPDVHHVAAVLALAARVQTDPVIAPAVRARLTLHQGTPHQPRERAVDQGLAAGLLFAGGRAYSVVLAQGCGLPGRRSAVVRRRLPPGNVRATVRTRPVPDFCRRAEIRDGPEVRP